MGTWPGPSIITCTSCPGLFGKLAKGVEFGELRFVVRVRDTAGAEAIAERECNIIGLHDLADFLEIIVEETLLVVSKAPFGHDGAAARYDAGNAPRRHRNIRQTHARIDRKSTRLNSS